LVVKVHDRRVELRPKPKNLKEANWKKWKEKRWLLHASSCGERTALMLLSHSVGISVWDAMMNGSFYKLIYHIP
jgi:hypothetical protein